MITKKTQNRKHNSTEYRNSLTPELGDKLGSLPNWVLDEMKGSAIAPDVIALNVNYAEDYKGFCQFIDWCNIENARTQGGAITAEASKYNHLYEGYWFVDGCPQVKPKNPRAYVKIGDKIERKGFGNDKKSARKDYPSLAEIEDRKLDISYSKLQSLAQKNKLTPPKNTLEDKLNWCRIFGVKVKVQVIKYENIKGEGTPFTFIDIPFRVIRKVAKKYKIESLPENNYSAKWQWIEDNPQIPISITEGVKKAMALVSNNIIAIASISITTHSEKRQGDQNAFQTELKEELKPYLRDKREVYVTFDSADKKASSRKAVDRQTLYLTTKLEKKGCKPKIIKWTDQECKGIDDYILKYGRKGLNELYQHPSDYGLLKVLSFLSRRKLSNAIKINTRRLVKKDGTVDPKIQKAIDILKKIVCLKSQQSTGKTQVIEQLSKRWQYEGMRILSITCSQFLAEDQSKRLGIHCYKDKVTSKNELERLYGVDTCIDSILKLPEDEHFDVIFLDEFEQLILYMLTSDTDMKNHRLEKIERLFKYLENAEKIIVADADLSDYSVNFLQSQLGLGDNDTVVIENTCKPFKGRELHSFECVDALRYHLKSLVSANLDNPMNGRAKNEVKKRFMITASSQKVTSKNSAINIARMLLRLGVSEDEIIVLDAETTKDPDHKAYKITKNLSRLKDYTYVIASPTLTTGVSLNPNDVGIFDYVFGFFQGNYPIDSFSQQIERYRGDSIRFIWLPESSQCIDKSLSGSSRAIQRLLGLRQNIAKDSFDFECVLEDLHIELQALYCKFTSRINNETYHLRDMFEVLSEAKGYTIIKVPKNGVGSFDKELTKETRKEAKDIVKESTKQRSIDTAESYELDSISSQKVRDQEYKKHSDNVALEKYKLRKRYGDNNISELINEYIEGFTELYKLDATGKLYQQLVNSFLLTLNFQDVKNIEKAKVKKAEVKRKEQDEKNYFLHSLSSIKRLSIRALLQVLGIDTKEIDGLKTEGDRIINDNHEAMALLKKKGRRKAEDQLKVNEILNNFISQSSMDELLDQVDERLTNLQRYDPMQLKLVGISCNTNADHSNRKMQRLKSILALLGYDLKIVARAMIDDQQRRFYRIVDRADQIKENFRSLVFEHFDQTLINQDDVDKYALGLDKDAQQPYPSLQVA